MSTEQQNVLELADLVAQARGMLNAGQRPAPEAIDLTLNAVRGDVNGAYWNTRHPSHRDVTRMCAELVEIKHEALSLEGE